MSKNKMLGKDELLDVLLRMRRIADKYTKIGMYGLGVSDSDNARDEERLEKFKQAYQQIKQMIENWPEKDYTKCSMGKIAEEFNVSYSLVHALERRINEDIQPEVDETILDDWAKEMADILWGKTKYSDRINFLRKRGKKLLTEAGVKIVGGKE